MASLMHPFALFALVFALLVSGLSGAAASPDEQDLSEGGAGNAVIPDYPATGHVLDSADALTSAEEKTINQQIDSLKSQTSSGLNIDVYFYSNSFVDSQTFTDQVADSWYADGAHGGESSILIAINMASGEGYINADVQTGISDDQKVDIMVNRMIPYYIRGENLKGTQVGIEQIYKIAMKVEADRQAAAVHDQIKRAWLILLIVGAVLVYLGVVGYFVLRRRRARYRFADAQIYDALSANPRLNVSDEMRKAYRSYRAYYHHDPAVGQIAYNARLRTKSMEDEQPYTFYVPNFEQWLPLYQERPELYAGKGRNPDGRFS